MSKLIVEGGHPITGTIRPVGNKNSILPLICAAVLTDESVTFHNVPKTSSVRIMLRIFQKLGGKVSYLKGNSVKICAKDIKTSIIDKDLAKKERAALMFLGPLLARFGQAEVGEAGGCKLGNRPVDTLFQGLLSMGAIMDEKNIYKFSTKGLKGNPYICQLEASVVGTENLILTSVLAKGTTVIFNAACEPHVQDLCNFLNSIGAQIEGIGSNRLTITGVEKLSGGEWEVISDHIDIGGLIITAAITGGELTIEHAIPQHMAQILNYMAKVSLNVKIDGDKIIVPKNQELVCKLNIKGDIDKIYDAPLPVGVPMDLIPQFIILAASAAGNIKVHSFFYETQLLGLYEELLKMRAKILLADTKTILTFGPSKFKGTNVNAPGIIQCAHAVLMAGMAAEGVTTINNADIVSRRFPEIVQTLRKLGAKIEK